MMNETHIDLKSSPEVAALIRKAGLPYSRSDRAVLRLFSGEMTLDSSWSCGSKDHWAIVSLTDNRVLPLPETDGLGRTPSPVLSELPDGFALIRTSVFQGKKMPAVIYLNPANLTPLLPASADLYPAEQYVLDLHCDYKSAYRREEAARHGINADRFSGLVELLKAKGLLSKTGGVTVEGRNARKKRADEYYGVTF